MLMHHGRTGSQQVAHPAGQQLSANQNSKREARASNTSRKAGKQANWGLEAGGRWNQWKRWARDWKNATSGVHNSHVNQQGNTHM
jgi:hypothetical protein